MHGLLRVLAAGRDVAELGTAFGEGAAALAVTARSVVTVELDPNGRPRVIASPGPSSCWADCYELLHGRGPFGLVFADGGAYDWEAILALLEPGGLIVKDDLTPGRPVEGDAVREVLLRDPRVVARLPASAAIVAAKL